MTSYVPALRVPRSSVSVAPALRSAVFLLRAAMVRLWATEPVLATLSFTGPAGAEMVDGVILNSERVTATGSVPAVELDEPPVAMTATRPRAASRKAATEVSAAKTIRVERSSPVGGDPVVPEPIVVMEGGSFEQSAVVGVVGSVA